MRTREEFVNKAISLIGCNEADGSFRRIIDTYNGHEPLARGYAVQYYDEWCATFVSAVSIMCRFTDIIPTECGCERMIDLFKELDSWVEDDAYTPKAGDIIFYDWDDNGAGDDTGFADHVGIVVNINGGEMGIVEGNNNGAVRKVNFLINSQYIRGYAVPKYDEAEIAQDEKKPVEEIVAEVMRGDWGDGEERINRLTAAGYDAEEIRLLVNERWNGGNVETSAIEVGSTIQIKSGAVDYDSAFEFDSFVYDSTFEVIEIDDDRVVFGIDGIVTGATNINNCIA